MATAVSGTVGNGNIAGVALAIALGGPGATFWMVVCGLLGMSSKFVECTLGVKYRDIGEDGTVYGGPMYYLSKGLKEKGFATLGKITAVLFAVFCSIYGKTCDKIDGFELSCKPVFNSRRFCKKLPKHCITSSLPCSCDFDYNAAPTIKCEIEYV